MHTAAQPHASGYQAHHIVHRIKQQHEPDFTDLGPFVCRDFTLSRRQHQVVAMLASGFQSDRIVADYLGIKIKYVQAIVADLKKTHGWQSRHQMVRLYQAMREAYPEGVKRMENPVHVSANGHTAVAEPSPAGLESKPVPVQSQSIDIANLYPAAAVEAAYVELEKSPISRRCGKVFTPGVVAVWLDWIDEGKGYDWIADYNGLVPTTIATVRRYIELHQEAANLLRGKVEARPVTADQPVDMTGMVEHLAEVFASAAALRSITLEVETQRTESGLKMSLEIKFKK